MKDILKDLWEVQRGAGAVMMERSMNTFNPESISEPKSKESKFLERVVEEKTSAALEQLREFQKYQELQKLGIADIDQLITQTDRESKNPYLEAK